MSFYLSVGYNGRIVIPKQIRKELDIKEGSTVVAIIKDNALQISSIKNTLSRAQALVKQYCNKDISLVDTLLQIRKEDVKKENLKYLKLNKSSSE